MNGTEILALPMGPNDAKAETVGGYLRELLHALWHEEEGFSGKRPFGNSGWSYELAAPLVKAGAVPGSLDEDGFLDDFDRAELDKAVHSAIEAMR